MSPNLIFLCLFLFGWGTGLAFGVWLSNKLWPAEQPEPAYKRALTETYGEYR